MTQLQRETRSRVYPVFLFALAGFAAGWLLFGAFGKPSVVINNAAPHTDPWAPSSDPSIASTTKVDNLDAATQVLARGNFRITSPTGPTITSGAGAPASAAPAGSVYYRTNGTQYTNTDGTGGGWTVVFQSGTFPVSTCAGGTAATSIANTGAASCSTFFNTAGDHLSSSGSTVSLAQIATASFLGRTTAGPGNVETLTATQATALLNVVTTSVKGLAPTLPNDATKFLDGTGNYTVPPGTGVTSVVAGQSITVTGTTIATVALNFPTTACSAGQAVTSHNSAGTPSCSTFVNAAGTGLSLSSSTLSVNITGASCGAGQAVTAISSAGVGTCTSIASLTSPQWIFGDGSDTSLTFNGVTTPLAGATLSGSTYTMTRDIFCHNCTINAGVHLTGPYRFYDDGSLTLNGDINRNGNPGSGITQGAALAAGNLPASFAGGIGGSSAGGAAGGGGGANPAPRECTAGTVAASGGNGGTCQGGSGGAGAGGAGGAGGTVTLASATTSGDARTWYQAPLGRQANAAVYAYTSGGGGGRGDAGNVKTGGGGGGSAGYVYVAAHAITGSGDIESKGGDGAAGQSGGNTGGGSGGSGGYIVVVIGSGSCPTFVKTGGAGGAGQGTGGSGGTGGTGISHCFGP